MPRPKSGQSLTEPLRTVRDIPSFPFETFEELQAAIKHKSYGVGVDPLAAAEWSDQFASNLNRGFVAALSVLIFLAAGGAIVVGIYLKDYWLLAALPVMASAFYLSSPTFVYHRWATIGGAVSIAVFVNLLFNGLITAAVLVAYAGLTFAAFRAAGYLTSSGFRRYLLSDEAAFMAAFEANACEVRQNKTERVFANK